MNVHQLIKNVDVRTAGSAAAGATGYAGTTIDTYGYDGVMFVFTFGALTATQVTNCKLQGGAAANGSDAADIAGSHTSALADTDSNKAQVIDLYRPAQRYITPYVNRGTANAVVQSITAILYHAETTPPTFGTTVSGTPVALAQAPLGTA